MRLIALILQAKCFTSELRIDPYSPVSSCALVKQSRRKTGAILSHQPPRAILLSRSSIDDLAALIIQNRIQLERVFESEIVKLKVVYGDRAVAQALEIAQQAERRDRVSISGNRRRLRINVRFRG